MAKSKSTVLRAENPRSSVSRAAIGDAAATAQTRSAGLDLPGTLFQRLDGLRLMQETVLEGVTQLIPKIRAGATASGEERARPFWDSAKDLRTQLQSVADRLAETADLLKPVQCRVDQHLILKSKRDGIPQEDAKEYGPGMWKALSAIEDKLSGVLADLPSDGLAPKYRVLPESRDEVGRAVALLKQALSLLSAANKREQPRFNAHPS